MSISRGARRTSARTDPPPTRGTVPNGIEAKPDLSASDAQIVAELGTRALTEQDISAVLLEAVTMASQRLSTELADILEMVPGGEGFLMTAGVGWREGYVGQVVVPLISESQASFTVASDEPVVVEDLAHDKRFPPMPLLVEHKAISSASVVLRGHARVHGILSVHTCRKRKFAAKDIKFLESIAAVVAAALDRRDTEQELRDAHDRLNLAMEAGRMGTWEWNVKTNEVQWSETLEKIHGIEPGTFSGSFEAYTADIHEEDRDRVFEAIQQSLSSGSYLIEYRIVRPDGEVRWLAARGVLLSDPRGEPLRMIGVCSDVTERKTTERELQTLVVQLELARQRVDNVVSNVPGVVWEAWGQPDGAGQRIDFVSGHVENMLGYSVEEWLGTPNFWLSIVHPEDRERAARESAAIFAGKGDGDNRTEFRWVARDGRVIWVEAQSTVIRDAEGKPVGMRGVTMDITHRREAEAKLRESEERFSKAFHASPAGLSIVSADDRRFLDVNDSFLQTTGHTREEIIGKLVDETNLWPSESERQALQDALVTGDGHAHNLELQILTASGDYRSVLGSAEVITLGGRQCILSLTYDITERKLAEQRQSLLAEAGSIFASSLDYEGTLQDVARLLVGRLADICSIDMVEGTTVRRVALAHVDPEAQITLDKMDPVYTPAPDSDHPVLRVTRSRKPELHVDLDPSFVAAAARDGEHQRTLRKLGVRSAIVVPLIAGGHSLGALTLAYSTTGRRYSAEDLQFAEELARRAGFAIDNALRYEAEQDARRSAELFAERTARLQAVTAALSESLTAAEVGHVVIEAAMAVAGARSGVIAIVAPGGSSLRLIAAEGVAPGFHDTWDEFAEDPPDGVIEAIVSASPMFIESRKDLLEAFPSLEKLSVVEGRSFGSVPLRVENGIVGSMVLTFDGPTPSENDREFVFALGRQCAQALERARLFDAEQEARRLAEEANVVVSQLQSLTEAVLTHHSVDELLHELLRRVHEMLEVDTTNVLLLKDEKTLKLRGSIGLREHIEEGFEVPVGRGIAGTIAASKKPLITHDLSAIEVVSPFLRGRIKSLMGVPLVVEDRAIGVMHVGTIKRRQFTEDEVRLLGLIGDRLALAIDHIQLYEAEQRARADAEAAESRQSFIAQASAILSASLDYEATLSSLARLCVPYLGDWCAIDILVGDTLERVAVVHTDPSKVDTAYRLRNEYPPDMQEPNIQRLLAGESVVFADIPEELLVAAARNEEHLEIMRQLTLRSLIAVPLKARGRIFGTMVLGMAESGRSYGDVEVALAEDLGHRAGLAVDNARLFSESQVIQEELRFANEAKDEFLGLVSHELRTPITTIYGGARLMRSRADNLDAETQRGVLEDIEHESERLHRIVEDLLVLARVELGQEVVTEPILVQRLTERTVNALTRRKAGRRIEVDTPADLPSVRASSVYLEQILRNLINNADKYSPSHERIEISARREGDEVVISVSDRGPGLPSEELDLIFERFYRSSGTAKQAGGAGIGLTVCKRLVEAQDGRIWAEAHENGGLTISFSLPVYHDADD